MQHDAHHDMPLLGGIAALLRWLEELTVLVSVPLLTLGLGISLVDLLTGGTLLQSTPWLAYLWAISQAIGIEGQLAGAAWNIRNAYTKRAFFAAGAYACLTFALAYVAFLAAQAFTLHESNGLTVSTALSLIGIDSVSWSWQRAIIAVALVILGSLLRYRPQKVQAIDEAARLRDEIELSPLRAQAEAAKAQERAAKMLGARTVAAAMIKGAAAAPTQPSARAAAAADPYPPNQTPWGESPRGAPLTPPAGFEPAPQSIHLVPDPPTRTPKRRATPRRPRGATNWQTQARESWDNGARSVNSLAKAVPGMSRTAAAYWHGVFRAEQRGADNARREA